MKKALPRYIHHHSRWLIIFLILVMASVSLISRLDTIGHVGAAAPQATTSFCNNSSIAINDFNQTGQSPSPGNPNPSSIAVSGLTGSISGVTLTLNNISHTRARDIDVLLVGPSGRNIIVMSDAGGINAMSGVNLTLSDSGATTLPLSTLITSGTYKPTDHAPVDSFASPAPAGPYNSPATAGTATFASVFNGIDPNGTWSLYVVDDAASNCPCNDSIGGGWCLSITTVPDAVTNTSVASSLNPSFTGDAVTFTATVTSGGNPVTAGTVTFKEGATVLAGPTAVNGSGQASFTTSSLSEGEHVITASYNGSPGAFNISSGNMTQVVDNHTVVNGNMFCNPGSITINDFNVTNVGPPAPSTPYPSRIFVAGLTGTVCGLTVKLNNISHPVPRDIDILLVAPSGASMIILSDVDGTTSTTGSPVTITLDDAAVSALTSAPLVTGTYKPTNITAGDTFPAAAPAGPYASPGPVGAATFASTFTGIMPNGTWSLYVVDDAATSPQVASIAGWCLTITTGAATEILTQPSDQTVCSGGSASFNVIATGGGTLTYQWRKGTTPLVNGGNISGADTATLTINPATSADAASNYNVVVTGSCGSAVSNNASLTINQPPTMATVGGPQTICANGTTAGLGGNTPSVGTGSWSVVSGGAGAFSSNTDPNATFTHTSGAGPIVVRWTISNSPCADSSADVTITINQPPTTATVGGPQTICANGTTTGLGGNTPAVGTGTWSIVSGGTGTFSSNTNPNATFTHTGGAGPIVLRWTISNPPCADSTADVTITINQPPTTATVGGGQSICANGTTAGLGGNTPAVGTGTWSIVSGGTGTFSSNTNPNATFTHTGGAGPVVVRWTISNPPCADSSADVTITINPSPATPTITPTPSPVCANSTGNQASGPAGASSYAWTISNGTITSASNIQTITYTAGASGSVTLNLTVTNSSGCSASNSASVPINPPPTAVCKNITVALNSSGTVSITAADVDNGSTAPCGLGSMTVSPSTFTCANKGANSVTLTVTDTAGNTSQCTATVTVVDNTPPVINSCPSNIVVAAAPLLCSAVVNFNVTATDNCNGVTVACTPPSSSVFPVGTTTVNCTATDTSGNTSPTCTFTVTVTNPAPVVAITGPPSGSIFATNTSVNFTGTFTDAGGGTHTAQWTFVSDTQNLSQAGTVNELTGAVTATRSFTTPGVYAVMLTVTDSCGGTGSANTIGVLTALIVIYDPEGAFLTGGGWINSPTGAYVANPAVTGKANFGLNAKYKNNATFPTGNTEFHLNSVNFRFKATSYDWLVVTGAKAQYQGSGTVNNQGDYGFIVTVIDGQVSGGTDKFRIKIWDKNNNDAVVYDSQMNDPNSADPTITPGGGNIVIHN